MTLRRIALAALVFVAILAGLAGFYLREPPASAAGSGGAAITIRNLSSMPC